MSKGGKGRSLMPRQNFFAGAAIIIAAIIIAGVVIMIVCVVCEFTKKV